MPLKVLAKEVDLRAGAKATVKQIIERARTRARNATKAPTQTGGVFW